jgi:hypothetical protein
MSARDARGPEEHEFPARTYVAFTQSKAAVVPDWLTARAVRSFLLQYRWARVKAAFGLAAPVTCTGHVVADDGLAVRAARRGEAAA